MMKAVLDRTYLVISCLDIDEAEKDALRQKARNYFNECGCVMGSFFLMATVAGLISYVVFTESVLSLSWSIGLPFLAAIGGKLLGMAKGNVSLFLLYRRLSLSGAFRLQEQCSK
jgi:hypothetical protein